MSPGPVAAIDDGNTRMAVLLARQTSSRDLLPNPRSALLATRAVQLLSIALHGRGILIAPGLDLLRLMRMSSNSSSSVSCA